jgi:hypothetical protein
MRTGRVDLLYSVKVDARVCTLQQLKPNTLFGGADSQSPGVIQIQRCHRGSTGRCQAFNPHSVRPEMLRPGLSPWME